MFQQLLYRLRARLVDHIDGPLLTIALALMAFGLATVYSATYDANNRVLSQLLKNCRFHGVQCLLRFLTWAHRFVLRSLFIGRHPCVRTWPPVAVTWKRAWSSWTCQYSLSSLPIGMPSCAFRPAKSGCDSRKCWAFGDRIGDPNYATTSIYSTWLALSGIGSPSSRRPSR